MPYFNVTMQVVDKQTNERKGQPYSRVIEAKEDEEPEEVGSIIDEKWRNVEILAVQEVTGVEFYIQALGNHDWYYMMTEDRRVYNEGVSSFARLDAMRKSYDKDYTIWNQHCPKDFVKE